MEAERGRQELPGSGTARVPESPVPSADRPLAPESTPAPSSWDWAILYRDLAPRLIRLGQRRFGMSREDAEEALQNAALRVSQSAAVVREPGKYFVAAFFNEARSLLRRRNRMRTIALEDAGDCGDDPVRGLDECIAVTKALDGVSPICREILLRWGGEGYSALASARMLGLSETTIARRLERCIKRFTRALT